MNDAPKPIDPSPDEVIRQLVVPTTEPDTDDGSRSVTKDRDLGESAIAQPTADPDTEPDDQLVDEPVVIRELIVMETQPEG